MNKMFAVIIGLAMLIAAPLSVMAQTLSPAPMPDDPVYSEDPGMMDPLMYYWPVQGGFDYADGMANGTYMDFKLDEATGTVSDYTARMVDYNFYYPMVYGYREGDSGYGQGFVEVIPQPNEYVVKFFDRIEFPDFVPNGRPGAFGQTLVFLGENVMMSFGDYEWSSIWLQFGAENDTVVFKTPAGFEVTRVPYFYELYDIPEDEVIGIDYGFSEGGASAPAYDYERVGSDYGYWSYDQVYLRNGNITCSIWVDRGAIAIDGNTITITTYPGAYVSTSSWIEYGWQYIYADQPFLTEAPENDKGAISTALDSGLMAAVGYLFAGEGGAYYSDSRALNDPTFKLEFKNLEQNRFQVDVKSDIKNGRIVALNVNKNALNAESAKDLRVLLDDQKIKACASMDDLVGMHGGDRAGYYMVSGNSQNTVFVYVPSFSTHTITVGLADGLGGVVIPAVLAVGFIAAVVGLALHRGKRDRDEL